MSVLRGKRVLVADDEPFIRFCVAHEIEDAGGEAIEAIDGAEALALIEVGVHVDALVTDVRMPNLDGWTLAERVRDLHPHLPVLYVTGHSDVSARPVPGAEIIAKPFRPMIISEKVADLMTRAGRS